MTTTKEKTPRTHRAFQQIACETCTAVQPAELSHRRFDTCVSPSLVTRRQELFEARRICPTSPLHLFPKCTFEDCGSRNFASIQRRVRPIRDSQITSCTCPCPDYQLTEPEQCPPPHPEKTRAPTLQSPQPPIHTHTL